MVIPQNSSQNLKVEGYDVVGSEGEGATTHLTNAHTKHWITKHLAESPRKININEPHRLRLSESQELKALVSRRTTVRALRELTVTLQFNE